MRFNLGKAFVVFLVLFCSSQAFERLNLTNQDVSVYVSNFEKQLRSHIENILAYNSIRDMLQKQDDDLHTVRIKGSDIFKEIHEKVSVRYNDLVLATNKLKKCFETQGCSSEFPPQIGKRRKRSLKRNRKIRSQKLKHVINGISSSDMSQPQGKQVETKYNSHTNVQRGIQKSNYFNGRTTIHDKELLVADDNFLQPEQEVFHAPTFQDVDKLSISPAGASFESPQDPVSLQPDVHSSTLPTTEEEEAHAHFQSVVSSPISSAGGGHIGPQLPPLPGGYAAPSGGDIPPPAPSVVVPSCCEPSYYRDAEYNGRLQEKAKKEACGDVSNIQKGLVQKMQENYDDFSTVTWQYFIEKESGAYVQYPSNHRHCDVDASSPLEMTSFSRISWLVEKLHMERKNLVLLVDNTDLPSHSALVQAVVNVLSTLVPNDKVNVVLSPSSLRESGVDVFGGCTNTLLEVGAASKSKLEGFVRDTSPKLSDSFPLTTGLEKVYQLLESETKEVGFSSRSNLVLILVNGGSKVVDNSTVMETLMADYQQKLNGSVQHFVYVAGQMTSNSTLSKLALVADQNNHRLSASSHVTAPQWTNFAGPVGKEGILEVVADQSRYPTVVERYFQRLPPQLDTELTTFLTRTTQDDHYPVNVDPSHVPGITVNVAVPVYNQYRNDTLGIVATEGTLATVFSEIVNFHHGDKNYMYLVDCTHGHVVLHPKLDEPSEQAEIFPKLLTLERDLTDEQRRMILAASAHQLTSFVANLTGLHPEIDGELVPSLLSRREEATVYFQAIYGTRLTVVLVHFLSDATQQMALQATGPLDLHGVYHRLDVLYGSPERNVPDRDAICHRQGGHFLSYKQSVIKLAPSLFIDPELYKNTKEDVNTAVNVNQFITMGTTTDHIVPEEVEGIMYTLNATEGLDAVWAIHFRDIIERFYGSAGGVFRLYPGAPMLNTFDHRQTDWYKRSVAFPNRVMYHVGRLTHLNMEDVIIVSKAIMSSRRKVLGVAGMTVTPRFLTSQLSVAVPECFNPEKQCHIIDTTGKVLDSQLGQSDSHILKRFPWLTRKLAALGKIKSDWCTRFSQGYHKMTLTLTESVTSDTNDRDPCTQFIIQNIAATNLFLLVIGSREMCDDNLYQPCASCSALAMSSTGLPKCEHCLSNTTSSLCQCECACSSDLDRCDWQYLSDQPHFPDRSCFSVSVASEEFPPNSPGPMDNLDRCPIACAAISDMDVCAGLSHCKASDALYPACIWRGDEELAHLNISRFLPSTTPQTTAATITNTLIAGTSLLSPVEYPTPNTSQSATSPSKPWTTRRVPQTSPTDKPSSLYMRSTGLTQQSSTSTKTTYIVQTPGVTPVTTEFTVAKSLPTVLTLPTLSSSTKPSTLRSSSLMSLPVMTSHPVKSSTTVKPKSTRKPGVSENKPRSNPSSNNGMGPGAIAGVVVGLLVLATLGAVLTYRVCGRRFQCPGADDSHRYETGSGLFNSALFLRHHDQVSLNTETPVSTTPYEQIVQ